MGRWPWSKKDGKVTPAEDDSSQAPQLPNSYSITNLADELPPSIEDEVPMQNTASSRSSPTSSMQKMPSERQSGLSKYSDDVTAASYAEPSFGLRHSKGSGGRRGQSAQDDVKPHLISRCTVGTRNFTETSTRRDLTCTQRAKKSIRRNYKYHQELVVKGCVEFPTTNEYGKDVMAKTFHPYPRLRKIVLHRYFEYSMTVLILTNCVVIGWQAELRNPEGTVKIINTIIEQTFTTLFFCELILRSIVYNWTFFFDNENHLDIFLVTLSVLNAWILGPLQIEADFLRKATVIRILRLVRIARSVKRKFKEMWQLLRGLVDSFETLVWTYVMMFCVLYFFGIVATMLFGKLGFFDEDEEAKELTEHHFSNVMISMFTLFRIMTLDSWADISRPLSKVRAWSQFFFVLFISVSVFLLMNLITAVIVDQAFIASQKDADEIAAEREKEQEAAEKEIRQMFIEIDFNGSGQIDKGELAQAWKSKKVRAKFHTMDLTKKDLLGLWDVLDSGGDGELEIDEFILGLRKIKGEAKAKDILRLYREVNVLEDAVHTMANFHDKFVGEMKEIKKRVIKNTSQLEATRRTLVRIKEMARLAAKSQPMSSFNSKQNDEEDDLTS